jgi:hypothetical protein
MLGKLLYRFELWRRKKGKHSTAKEKPKNLFSCCFAGERKHAILLVSKKK